MNREVSSPDRPQTLAPHQTRSTIRWLRVTRLPPAFDVYPQHVQRREIEFGQVEPALGSQGLNRLETPAELGGRLAQAPFQGRPSSAA